MRIELSNRQSVPGAVRECFATDPELLEKWHIAAPGTLDQCVEKTAKDAEGFDLSFRFYLAFVGEELVGYWGTEWDRYLNLIFVKPNYRKPNFMKDFWKYIKRSMNGRFATAVYARNLPAIGFYSKHGKKIQEFQIHGHPAVSFTFEKEPE